jgi:hypothetical protein
VLSWAAFGLRQKWTGNCKVWKLGSAFLPTESNFILRVLAVLLANAYSEVETPVSITENLQCGEFYVDEQVFQ